MIVMATIMTCVAPIRANVNSHVSPEHRYERTKEREVRRQAVVKITSYHSGDFDTKTADGSVIIEGVRWCAVSRDLMDSLDIEFGDTLVFNDVGYAVKDNTHRRMRMTVDILVHDRSMMLEYDTVYVKEGNR